MNETNPNDRLAGPTGESDIDLAAPQRSRASRRRAIVLTIGGLAVLLVASVFVIWFLRTRQSVADRPVPAPRNMPMQQPGEKSPQELADTTLTIAPELVASAGIKTELVGERPVLSSENGVVATGVVREDSYHATPVVTLVGGIVRTVNFELGARVTRGQTVAVVFSNELAMAQAGYLTAFAELDEHHKHHRREMQLVEIGAASREELEQATTNLRTAESSLAAQRQKLLLLGLAPQQITRLEASRQITSEVSLPAPLSGSIIARTANPGEVIEANKEILRIADLSSVWVVGQVQEKELGPIRVGSGASISTEAYPGRTFRGTVAYIDPSLDPVTRTAQVRIELANPAQALKLGMYVNVLFGAAGGGQLTEVVVPKAAVQEMNNQPVVFVATREPNVFALRRIRTGPEVNGQIAIPEGLATGERIVSEGSFMLRAEWSKQHPR